MKAATRAKSIVDEVISDLGLPLTADVEVDVMLVVRPGRRLAWKEWRSLAGKLRRRLMGTRLRLGGFVLLRSQLLVALKPSRA